MLINNFLHSEDGDWASNVLEQTRQAWFELVTESPVVQLASKEESDALFKDLVTPGENVPAVVEDPEEPV